jgi:hypothetical protein
VEEDRVNPVWEEAGAEAAASVPEGIVFVLNAVTNPLTSGVFPVLNPNAPNAAII